MKTPFLVNDLDRAIMALQRSRAAMPEFYRRLSEGELWFYMRYQPDIVGETLELKNGSPMPFVRFRDKQGEVVPIFSSVDRAEEGLKKGKSPPRLLVPASMPAQQLLQILGAAGCRAVVNKYCATGEVTIPPDLMRDLANGKALAPLGMGTGKSTRIELQLLDPADYPTHLVQPVFELLRQHRNFKAAWIFTGPVTEPGKTKAYYLQFLMDPRDEVIHHDLTVVIATTNVEQDEFHHSLMDETSAPYIASMFQHAKPFYVAADYTPPAGA